MSTARKNLKIVSLVAFLVAVGYMLVAFDFLGIGFFGGVNADALLAMGIDMPTQTVGVMLDLVAATMAILFCVVAVLGLSAANVPSKIGKTVVVTLVAMVLSAVTVVLWALQLSADLVSVVCGVVAIAGLLVATAAVFFARSVRKEHEAWH